MTTERSPQHGEDDANPAGGAGDCEVPRREASASPALGHPSWLVIASAVSSYTTALFRHLEAQSGIAVRFLHRPNPAQSQFAHERFEIGIGSLRWDQASPAAIWRFIHEPEPELVFVCGTRARMPTALALSTLPNVPIGYVSDANVYDLAKQRSTLARQLFYSALFRRVDFTLDLGWSNHVAHTLLGAKKCHPIPWYAVDFESLDGEAGEAPASSGARRAPAPHPDPLSTRREGDSSRVRVAWVARLSAEKAIVAVLEEIARDPVLTARLSIDLVGEGPERRAIEDVLRRHPALELRMHGACDRATVGRIVREANVTFHASTFEPWGIATVESLGLGVPVVASPAVGAAVSLAGRTQAVVIAEAPTPQSFRSGIHEYLTRREQLEASATACVPGIRARYGFESVIRDLLALRGSVCARRATRGG